MRMAPRPSCRRPSENTTFKQRKWSRPNTIPFYSPCFFTSNAHLACGAHPDRRQQRVFLANRFRFPHSRCPRPPSAALKLSRSPASGMEKPATSASQDSMANNVTCDAPRCWTMEACAAATETVTMGATVMASALATKVTTGTFVMSFVRASNLAPRCVCEDCAHEIPPSNAVSTHKAARSTLPILSQHQPPPPWPVSVRCRYIAGLPVPESVRYRGMDARAGPMLYRAPDRDFKGCLSSIDLRQRWVSVCCRSQLSRY